MNKAIPIAPPSLGDTAFQLKERTFSYIHIVNSSIKVQYWNAYDEWDGSNEKD